MNVHRRLPFYSDCDLPNNPLYIDCNKSQNLNRNQPQHDGPPEQPLGGFDVENIHRGMLHTDPEDVVVEQTDRGMELSLPTDSEVREFF